MDMALLGAFFSSHGTPLISLQQIIQNAFYARVRKMRKLIKQQNFRVQSINVL